MEFPTTLEAFRALFVRTEEDGTESYNAADFDIFRVWLGIEQHRAWARHITEITAISADTLAINERAAAANEQMSVLLAEIITLLKARA